MSKIELTDDMPQELIDIVTGARYRGAWNEYDLVSYSVDELLKCLDYLADKDIYKSLQKEMKIEVNAKLSSGKINADARTSSWFPLYWWAVLSLFNKGPMDKNEEKTKTVLNKINKNWLNNCTGRVK